MIWIFLVWLTWMWFAYSLCPAVLRLQFWLLVSVLTCTFAFYGGSRKPSDVSQWAVLSSEYIFSGMHVILADLMKSYFRHQITWMKITYSIGKWVKRGWSFESCGWLSSALHMRSMNNTNVNIVIWTFMMSCNGLVLDRLKKTGVFIYYIAISFNAS